MTSLLSGTPLAAIWNRAVLGQVLEDVVSRLAQVVYSLAPSGQTYQFGGMGHFFFARKNDLRL